MILILLISQITCQRLKVKNAREEDENEGIPFDPKPREHQLLHNAVTSKNYDGVSKVFAVNMTRLLRTSFSNQCAYNALSEEGIKVIFIRALFR